MADAARRSRRRLGAYLAPGLLGLAVSCGPGLTTPTIEGERLPGLGGLRIDEFSLSPDGAAMLLSVLDVGGFELYRYEIESAVATALPWPTEMVSGGNSLSGIVVEDAVWRGPREALVAALGSFHGRPGASRTIVKGDAVVQSVGRSNTLRWVRVDLEAPGGVSMTDLAPKRPTLLPPQTVTRLGPIEVRPLPRDGLALLDTQRNDRVLAQHRFFGVSRLQVDDMAISSDGAMVAYSLSGARLGFVDYFLAVEPDGGERWNLRPADVGRGFAWHPTTRSLYANHRTRLYIWRF